MKKLNKNIFKVSSHSLYFKTLKSLFTKFFLFDIFLVLSCSEIGIEPKEEIIECEAIVDGWTFLGLENETVTAIAVDPIYPNVIYVGTKSDFSAGINGKLFKSTDCGKSWDTLLIGGSYRDILIDPANHNEIYALPGSIIKSEDAGKTWQTIINGIRIDPERRVQSLAIDPKSTNILYAGTGGFYGGTMYKSFDGGMQWNEIGNDSLYDGVVSIAINPIETKNIYAGTAFRGILWKSTDEGNSWFRTGLGEIGSHDIFIDPQVTNRIYVGVPGMGIFKTENGGINWAKINNGLPPQCSVMKIVESNSLRIFIVETLNDSGGVYEYSYLKNQWVRIGVNNLHVSYYYSALKNSSNPDRLFFGGKGGVYVMGLKE